MGHNNQLDAGGWDKAPQQWNDTARTTINETPYNDDAMQHDRTGQHNGQEEERV
jgi:hypothetical protein